MNGEDDLKHLLQNMSPSLGHDKYVFLSLSGKYGDYEQLEPICSFQEREGLTLIITAQKAAENNYPVDEVFKLITLEINSSLHAVGLTSAVSTRLAEMGISANMVAAFYHDHIFIPEKDAEKALIALKEFTN